MKTRLFLLGAPALLTLTFCVRNNGPTTYALAVTSGSGGSATLTVDGRAIVKDNAGKSTAGAAEGARIALSITEEAGFEFVRWTSTGVSLTSPTTKTQSFRMPANAVSLAAEFAEVQTYTIVVTPEVGGSATLTIDGTVIGRDSEGKSNATTFSGADIVLTASRTTGYAFDGWTATAGMDFVPAPTYTTTTFKMPAADVAITAGFSAVEYNISVTPGPGGLATLTIDGTLVERDGAGKSVATATVGSDITITAVEGEGFLFDRWAVVSGFTIPAPIEKTIGFTMPAIALDISAGFRTDPDYVSPGIEIAGIMWARCNVDRPGTFAATPQSKGLYYQWNRPVGWARGAAAYDADGIISTTWNAVPATGDGWAAANDPCPMGWRVPTNDEYRQLAGATTATYANEVYSLVEKATGNTLCFPSTGSLYDSSGGYSIGTQGQYWTASPATPGGWDDEDVPVKAANAYLGNSSAGIELGFNTPRASGIMVRCVAEQ